VRDLTHQTFDRLTVIGRAKVKNDPGRGEAWWGCLCKCGRVVTVRGDHLTSGKTQSCGCLQREIAQLMAFQRAAERDLERRSRLPINFGPHLDYQLRTDPDFRNGYEAAVRTWMRDGVPERWAAFAKEAQARSALASRNGHLTAISSSDTSAFELLQTFLRGEEERAVLLEEMAVRSEIGVT
jgi:hypothetical protein